MVNFLKYLFFFIILPFSGNAFDTNASQAMLFDLDSQTILFEKNASSKMTPSSMSKIMTTYIAFDLIEKGQISLDTKFMVSEKAWKTGGTKMFLEVGNNVEVEDLIKGVIIQSGNDAAITLAEGISGTEEKFTELMNEYAQKLGLHDSKFANSTGFPDPNHFMNCKDLINLAVKIYDHFPQYFNFFAQKELTHNNITQPNRNSLIGEMGIDGMKTGSTESGGYGLLISATQNDRRLFAVVNGLKTNTQRDAAALKIIKHGFDDFIVSELMPKGKNLGPVKIWHGSSSSTPLILDKSVKLVTSNKVKQEDINVVLNYNEPLLAPIKKGDVIAHLNVTHGDHSQKIAIKASEDIDSASIFRRVFQDFYTALERKFLRSTKSSNDAAISG